MMEPTDGDVTGNPLGWRKSSFCANGSCIEVAEDDTATIGPKMFIRDGKLGKDSRIIALTRAEFRTFIDAVKRDELGPVA